MAENEEERTEQPTPKRLEEARKKGQVPRSTELSAAAVILTVGGGLHFLGATWEAAQRTHEREPHAHT